MKLRDATRHARPRRRRGRGKARRPESATATELKVHLAALKEDGLWPQEFRDHVQRVRELRAILKRETMGIYEQQREEKLARLSENVVPFAERLKEYRTARGWSRRRVAKHLGISPITLRQWEVGKAQPNLENFRKVVLLSSRGPQWWLGM
jgi:ribosome-binding protein aMBF1 (putative translation factor)